MRILMQKKKTGDDICSPENLECDCKPGTGCKVEAILNVDERGQMVLPKEIREKAAIRTGDKLALISWEREGSVCCLALIKVENLNHMVKDVLSPLMGETVN